MTYWTDPIAITIFWFALGWVTVAAWRWYWRRDDQTRAEQRARLDTAVEAENRTADTVDLTERYEAVPTLREESIPMPGMVPYFGPVHPACAERWLRFDLRPVDGCAVWLTDSLKASTP